MPRFIIERQYLLPVYQHIEIEAPDLLAACHQAIEHDNWDSAKNDYDNSRPTTLTRAVELPEDYDLEDNGLAGAIYDPGLTPLPLPGDEQLALQEELDEIDAMPDDGPADVWADRRRAILQRLDELREAAP